LTPARRRGTRARAAHHRTPPLQRAAVTASARRRRARARARAAPAPACRCAPLNVPVRARAAHLLHRGAGGGRRAHGGAGHVAERGVATGVRDGARDAQRDPVRARVPHPVGVPRFVRARVHAGGWVGAHVPGVRTLWVWRVCAARVCSCSVFFWCCLWRCRWLAVVAAGDRAELTVLLAPPTQSSGSSSSRPFFGRARRPRACCLGASPPRRPSRRRWAPR
jgi:hypothetical protein